MTGIDCLREELEKRGFSKAQIESKVAAGVLDILSKSGDKYTDIWESENDASKRLREIESEIREQKSRIEQLQALICRYEIEEEKARKRRIHCEDYIDSFNESLRECETQEGRDAMRIAQMYINSIEVDTKYDNTAYIIGLASILSRGGINAIKELCKINKKLPEVNEIEWI